MRFTFAPHIECLQDGASYLCDHCGFARTFGPVILAKDYVREVQEFVRRHVACPSLEHRAELARLSAKVVSIGKARQERPAAPARPRRQLEPRAPRAPKPARIKRVSHDDILAETVKALAPTAERGRLRLQYVTDALNARAAEHGYVPIKAAQVAARLRHRGLRISAVTWEAQGGRGKCLLVDNEQFRRWAGVEG